MILAGSALIVLLGGSWYIARRLRDLQAMERDNQQLGVALVEAAEAERTRLGWNLHDDLGQHLTAIGMLSESLRGRLNDASPPLAADAARLARLAEETGSRARALTRFCVIDWSERAGLVRSVEGLCASANELFGFEIEARIDPAFETADPAVAPHIARIISEAINNAARHGNPAGMTVTMRIISEIARGDASRRAELLIEAEPASAQPMRAGRHTDRANASTPAALNEPGLGMVIMRARAMTIGGELQAIEDPGRGITIRCEFPWPQPHRSEAPGVAKAEPDGPMTNQAPRHAAPESIHHSDRNAPNQDREGVHA